MSSPETEAYTNDSPQVNIFYIFIELWEVDFLDFVLELELEFAKLFIALSIFF